MANFRVSTPFPREPVLWIGGDSFVEGDSLAASKNLRIAELLSDALQGSVVISGGGGATAADLAARLPMDLVPFRPRACLVLIGANDRDFKVWREGVLAVIRQVEARGAVPILGTLAPRADRQGFLNQANAWIRSSGIRHVDFATALTVGGDGVSWDSRLVLADGVHPSIAGHRLMADLTCRKLAGLFTGRE